MAYYSIRKRSRKNKSVYCVSIIQKERNKVTFSKSMTFSTKINATQWAKSAIDQLGKSNLDGINGLREATLGEMIEKYINHKSASNRPHGRTALYCMDTILKFQISKVIASKLRSRDIVEFCL
jgi:hypothetical protein